MISEQIAEFLFPGMLIRKGGAAADVADLLVSRGLTNGDVFIVADRFVHEAGMTVDLLKNLTLAGFRPHVFFDIAGEPDSEIVEKASAAVDFGRVIAIVGMGGGSALDIAKLVAYQTASGASTRDLKGAVPFVPNFPTLIMIPTTVGTGAEATRVAMFSVDGAKRAILSRQFVPDIAILDDHLVADLPPQVLAATALDALSHALESMMSSTSNELTWLFSGEAAQRIFARLLPAYRGDRPARSDLLYASFLAGVSLNAGVTLGHSMSYVLAAQYRLAHGVGCALALPFALAYNQTMPEQIGKSMAALVLGRSEATLRDLADAVQSLTDAVGLPTRIGDTDDHHQPATLGLSVVRDFPRPTNPVALDPDRLTSLFTYLRTGDLAGAWTAMEAAK